MEQGIVKKEGEGKAPLRGRHQWNPNGEESARYRSG